MKRVLTFMKQPIVIGTAVFLTLANAYSCHQHRTKLQQPKNAELPTRGLLRQPGAMVCVWVNAKGEVLLFRQAADSDGLYEKLERGPIDLDNSSGTILTIDFRKASK